jgi:hypothetical protein
MTCDEMAIIDSMGSVLMDIRYEVVELVSCGNPSVAFPFPASRSPVTFP